MFELPKLTFEYTDLEPYMSADTVETHYTKHHQTYLDKFNKALENHKEYFKKSIEDIIKNAEDVPKDIYWDIRKNGGGYYNHNLFWQMIGKVSDHNPIGDVEKNIIKHFGTFEKFKENFSATATDVFGSGYAWLVENKNGKFEIKKSQNQDCPLSYGELPVLSIDVWEHAYYLDYKNKRAEFIEKWWNIINWKGVEELYQKNKKDIKF